MKQSVSIERPVGEGETNRSSDLEAVRNALAERGFCRRSIAGQWNAKYKQDLTAGIRLFQRKAGLAPDGIVIPGGPTAHALALGGEVASTHAPAEGKLASTRTCAELRKLIDAAASQITTMSQFIQAKKSERRKLDAEFRQIISTLRQMARRLELGIDPSPRNLDAVSRILNNLPNDRDVQQAQGTLRDARETIKRIQETDEELAFTERELVKAKQRLKQRTDSFRIGCLSPAPTARV